MNSKGLTLTTILIVAIGVVALAITSVVIYSYNNDTITPDDTNITEPNNTGTPIDPIGGTPQNQTHLACSNRRCVVVQGAGSNLNGCTTINAACTTGGSSGGSGGSSGGSGSGSGTTGSTNQAPIAIFEAIPSSGVAALFVFFNASNSTDPDGTISNYEWNFGDSTNGTGVTTNHTYTIAGNYTATLTVTDNAGASNSASSTIFVGSPLDTTAPQYTIVAPTPPSPTAYAPTKFYNFSSTWTDNVGIAHVDLIFNGATYTTSASGSLYTRQLTDLPVGVHSYFFRGYDAANNMNQTPNSLYTVTPAAPLLSVNVNPSTVQPNVNATATVSGCPTQITCVLRLDGNVVTPPHSISYPNAGVHTYNYSTSGNTNYSATSVSATLTVTSSPTFTLTVTKQSTNGGNGTVTSNVSGINCGASCSASYVSGTNVQLTATPATGSSFTGWSGNCSGTGSCIVAMNSNRTVTATFALAPPNTPANLQATPVSPTQIDLTWADNSTNEAGFFLDRATNNAFSQNLQTFSIAANQQSFSSTNLAAATIYFYRIRATNAAGNSSNSNTASATTLPNSFTLTTNKTGQGTITSNPSGINCGSTCQASFVQGTVVNLNATPAVGWTFNSWSGACSGAICSITMNSNQAVTAIFTQLQQNVTLTVTKVGTGSGTVTSNMTGINCGSTCVASYVLGTNIQLTALANATSTFSGWSGACSGTGTCTVALNSNTSVIANFTVSVAPDTMPPNVTLISPSNGASFSSLPTFTAQVTDNVALKNATITVWSGNTIITQNTQTITGTSATPSFIPNIPNTGSYKWNVRAFDNAGNSRWGAANFTFNYTTPIPPSGNLSFSRVVVDATFSGDVKAVGDIDGDGYIDGVVGGSEMRWYRSPSWTRTTIGTPVEEFTTDMQLADVDNDGDLDIITGDGSGWNGQSSFDNIVWYENPRPTGNPASTWTRRSIGNSGYTAHDMEVADFDRDGKIDVLARKEGANKIFFQNTSTSWVMRDLGTLLPSNSGDEGVGIGDVDNDGDVDLVAGGIWLETPANPRTGSFISHTIAGSWSGAITGAVADINGDMRPDVIFTGQHDLSPLVWYESSTPLTGPWTAHTISNVGGGHKINVVDVNKDGRMDIVLGLELTETNVFLNNGGSNPSFTKMTLDTSASTHGLHNQRSADFDLDGDIDIFGANWIGNDPVILWRNQLNTPYSLTSWTYKQISNNHEQTFGLAFSDIDRDGRRDIVSGQYWYKNPGADMTGSWTRNSFPAGRHAILVTDVDGDAFADVIAQGEAPVNFENQIFWLEATNAAGTSWNSILIGVTPQTSHAIGTQGYRTAQLEAGGKEEIIVSSPTGTASIPGGIYYFRVPANPTAGNWPRVQVSFRPYDEGFAVGDIDRDGDMDIAATTGETKQVEWYSNPRTGAGNWAFTTLGSFTEATWPDRVELADMNKDGKLDVIISEENGAESDAQIYWWAQPANPSSGNWVRTLVATQGSSNNLDVADIDKDGDMDVIAAEHEGSPEREVNIYVNTGTGTSFTTTTIATGQESHLGGRTVDLDNDGDLDIVSIAWWDNNLVHLWRNDNAVGCPTCLAGGTGVGTGSEIQVALTSPPSFLNRIQQFIQDLF